MSIFLAEQKFHEIAPPVDYSFIPVWAVFLGSFVALCLLGAIVWFFVRKPKPQLPPKTPREMALEELDGIANEIDTADPYQFSIRVSDVLRGYVTHQYGLPLTRQTSIEFLTALAKTKSFSENEKSLLEDFLNRCDLIKFARYEATSADSRLLLVEASGIDIMLVLDVSGSMLTKDFTIGGDRATRLDAIREVTRKFIEGRPNDRIGIIAFAGRPYVVSPMTLDHDWLMQNLERVRIGLVEDGTAIGSAIASAANRLNDKHSKSRAIVLLTDGANNAGKISPNTAAEAVKALKIHFYAIGAGINGIAPPPIFTHRGPMTDMLGNLLYQNQRVEFNEAGLRQVAQIAGGQFFRATDTKSLEEIYGDIDKMEKSTVAVKKYQEYRDLFPMCIASACGLLVAQLLLFQTIWKKLP